MFTEPQNLHLYRDFPFRCYINPATAKIRSDPPRGPRRFAKGVMARFEQLAPAELAAIEVDLAVSAAAETALIDGRAALKAGDLARTEKLLLVAAAREFDTSAALLATIYSMQGNTTMARHWTGIALRQAGPLEELLDDLPHL